MVLIFDIFVAYLASQFAIRLFRQILLPVAKIKSPVSPVVGETGLFKLGVVFDVRRV
jgi:hypothetical protein